MNEEQGKEGLTLTQADMAWLELKFRTKQECTNITNELEKKLADDSTRLAVIEQRLKLTNWLLTVIGAGVLATIIKLFIGG